MKHATLRAAAHNIADSFANEVSFLVGWYGPSPVWRDVASHPQQELRFDLLNGGSYPDGCSADTIRFTDLIRQIVRKQLSREGCDPDDVTIFEVTLSKSLVDPISQREVIVTVGDETGRKSTDRYVGSPLRRLVKRDLLGRRRKERSALKSN